MTRSEVPAFIEASFEERPGFLYPERNTMPDTNNQNDGSFNLIPLEQAPGLVLRMIARFAEGLPEPMVIGASGQPVAALIPIADLLRLREYDSRALDAEDSFYSELHHRLHNADTTEFEETDLDAFARSLGPLGEQWASRRSSADKD
ncbi:hypothetical protein [Gordonia sp. GAMMA]|uniref:hypothetical protein n=1 Tax=Gordonia sp. GAMMA TaxID=2502241 RepID=UPI0010F635DE|nr:hypothetical protein [Gordonia sp. GAMMA]